MGLHSEQEGNMQFVRFLRLGTIEWLLYHALSLRGNPRGDAQQFVNYFRKPPWLFQSQAGSYEIRHSQVPLTTAVPRNFHFPVRQPV